MPQNIGDNRVMREGIARITPQDAERLARYRVRPGDIVCSRRGDVERRALIRGEEDGWLCGTGCLRVRLGDGHVDPKYASYYLGDNRVREWIVRHAHGATMANLNTSILSALPFVVPPRPAQRAIGYVLGTLDDKIELDKRTNETLEAIARALFKSWFVDFDPVRAKFEGRADDEPNPFAKLFSESMVDSEVGTIPLGWEIKRFADTVEIIGGGTPKSSVPEYWNGTIPWFSIADAPRDADVWVIDTEKRITQAGVDNSAARILSEGTTIVSARGTVGRVGLVGVPMTINQSCYGLSPRIGHGSFNYFVVRGLVGRLQRQAHGSVFDTITRDTFARISVATAPAALIDAFEVVVRPTLDRIRNNLYEVQTLETLRNTLLPRLISGELSLVDAEHIVAGQL